MKKINFQDLPNMDVPYDANTFNMLQDNVENGINDVQLNIGNLEDLTTTLKDNIVNAVNEIKTYIPTKTSDLENDSNFLTKVSNYLSFSSLDDLKKYLISNSVPSNAVNLFSVSLSGAGKGIMVQKTNNLYLSFIMWGYSGDCALYRYVNGTWYTTDLTT